MSNKYDDIINLPHHVSTKHPKMSLHNRAAQFAPFAALTGHDDAIRETARLTDKKILLDDSQIKILNDKLNYIESQFFQDEVKIIYFVPDIKKEGGSYEEFKGYIKKIDKNQKLIIVQYDKYSRKVKNINMEDIVHIEIGG